MNKASVRDLLRDVMAGRVDGPALFDREKTASDAIGAKYLELNEDHDLVVTEAGKAFVASFEAQRRAKGKASYANYKSLGLVRDGGRWS